MEIFENNQKTVSDSEYDTQTIRNNQTILENNERYNLLKSVFSEAVNQYEAEHNITTPELGKVITSTYYSIFMQLFCFSHPTSDDEMCDAANDKLIIPKPSESIVSRRPSMSATEYEYKSKAINTAKAYLGLAIDKKDKTDTFGKYLKAQPSVISYPRWTLSSNSIAGKLQIYTCETANSYGFKGVKYECVILTSKQSVFDFLISDDRAVESDPNLLGYKMIKQFDEFSALRRYYYASQWMITPRDFILYTTWRRQKDGSLLIATFSPPDDRKLYPHVKGYVRASVLNSCSLLRDYKVDGKMCCQLTMANHSLVGGSLSTSLINPLTEGYPPKYVAKLKKILEK